MFPRIYGGGSGGIREIGEDAKVNRPLRNQSATGAEPERHSNGYWGALSYTAGPPTWV